MRYVEYEGMRKPAYVWRLAGFVALATLYAASVVFGWNVTPVTKTLPVFYLAVITFPPLKLRNIWLPFALLLSSAGDLMGDIHVFLGQVAFFAAAHIAYVVYFVRGGWFRPSSLLMGLAIVAMAVFLGLRIVPEISVPEEKIFVLVYIVIISLMAASTLLWRGKQRWWYVSAAMLFMVSDTILAWNMFVEPIPRHGVLIMATYYAAQFLFAATYLSGFVRSSLK